MKSKFLSVALSALIGCTAVCCPYSISETSIVAEAEDDSVVSSEDYSCELVYSSDKSITRLGDGYYLAVEADESKSVINSDGEVCFNTMSEKVTYLDENRFSTDDSLLDEKGNVVRDITGYKAISGYSEGLCYVAFPDNEPETQVNEAGDTIYIYEDSYEYLDTAGVTEFCYVSERITTSDDNVWVSASGQNSFTYKYDCYNQRIFINGYAVYYDSATERYGYIDKTGNKITEAIFAKAYSFYGGLAVVYNSDTESYGVINSKGEFVLSCDYQRINRRNDDWISVFDGEAYTLYQIDESGMLLNRFSYENTEGYDDFFHAGEGIVGKMSGSDYTLWYYSLETGELLFPERCSAANGGQGSIEFFNNGYIHLYTGGSRNYFNSNGEKILDTDGHVNYWDRETDLFLVKNGKVSDIVDMSGNVLVSDAVFFVEDTYIANNDDGIYISDFENKGEEISLPYNKVSLLLESEFAYSDFAERYDLFTAQGDVGSGVIDSTGTELIPAIYADIKYISEDCNVIARTSDWTYDLYNITEINSQEPQVTTATTTTTTTTTTSTTTTTTTTTEPPIEAVYSLGDLDASGTIDPVDATLALQHYSLASMGGVLLTEEQAQYADVNGDGAIDPVDATYILRYYSYASMNGEGTFEEFIANN